jgi:adenylyltransferase/sulfurtransferase
MHTLTSKLRFTKPQIPSLYYVWREPPDSSGEESLHFVSHRRSVKLKGHAFADFVRVVVPLLDGRHTIDEIGSEVQDVFTASDLQAALDLLADHNLIRESDGDVLETEERLPQWSFFHELGVDPALVKERLRNASVAVLGMGGAGPGVAESLAKSAIGRVRCIDDQAVSPADLYIASGFNRSDLHGLRALAVQRRLQPEFPGTQFEVTTTELRSDDALRVAVEKSDYIAVCLDAGQSSLVYRLNRVCLQTGTRWISCALAGTEIVIGPVVYPRITPCYLCYKMRIVACAANPEDAFAFEKLLDERKTDDSPRRENLSVGAGLASNLLALEILRDLAGLSPTTTLGRVVIFNLLDLSSTKHVVLKKPWCPACFQLEPK